MLGILYYFLKKTSTRTFIQAGMTQPNQRNLRNIDVEKQQL